MVSGNTPNRDVREHPNAGELLNRNGGASPVFVVGDSEMSQRIVPQGTFVLRIVLQPLLFLRRFTSLRISALLRLYLRVAGW